MRRLAPVLTAVLAATLGLACGSAGANAERPAAPSRALPSVETVDMMPLVLRGARFVAGERIRVVVRADGRRYVRSTKATNRGTFVVRLRGVNRPCHFTVDARGSTGRTASFAYESFACLDG